MAVLDVLDGATFMVYRNTPDGVLDIAGAGLEAAGGCRETKTVYLAVETGDTGEGGHVDYHQLSRRRLEEDLRVLEHSCHRRGYRGFAGLAVHEYHTWASMKW